MLDFFRTYLEVYRPDAMLTYGGDPVTQGMIHLAKGRGIPVLFAIHNFAYTGLAAFGGGDYCVAPSEFACLSCVVRGAEPPGPAGSPTLASGPAAAALRRVLRKRAATRRPAVFTETRWLGDKPGR